MQEKTRYIEQDDSIQQGRQELEDTEENMILFNTVIDGGAVKGKEGGLRMDMFEHDDPDDLQCICDLPVHAQDIIISESDL